MEHKRLQITSEQTLRLEQLRQVLAETLPADTETEAYPTSHYATCGGTCFYACDSSCWPACAGTCWPNCGGNCVSMNYPGW